MAKETVTARTLDMAKAGEGSNFKTGRVPRGSYKAKVVKVQDHKSKDKNDMWLFTIELISDEYRRTFPYYCGFDENQLWKIRNLLSAAGLNVPKKKLKVDPTKAVGKIIGIELDDDEYDGKEKSVIVDIFPKSELAGRQTEDVVVEEDDDDVDDDDDDDEDEAPPKKKAKKKKAKPVVEDDDDDEDEDEDEDDDDEDVDDSDDDDDEDEDDEPEPPKKKKKKAKAKKKSKAASDDVDDDELEELDIDDL